MPFITINGLEIPVSSFKESSVGVNADQARSLSGAFRTTRSATKRTFSGDTPVMPRADALVIQALLTAQHDVIAGDVDTYSSKGVAPDDATGLSLDASNKKFGTSSVAVSSGTSRFWALGAPYDMTLLLWKRPGSGSFDHWAITRTGAGTETEYKNGTAGSYTTTNWKTLSSVGTVTLMGKNDAGTNTAVQYDDIVLVPALLTAAQIEDLAAATSAHEDSPNLLLDGDCVSYPAVVQCMLDNVDMTAVNVGSEIYYRISFSLEEV